MIIDIKASHVLELDNTKIKKLLKQYIVIPRDITKLLQFLNNKIHFYNFFSGKMFLILSCKFNSEEITK